MNDAKSTTVADLDDRLARIGIEGAGGGHTTVNGERREMIPADLILTPPGCWHDHGNLGTAPTIWLDVLDASLLGNLYMHFFEPHNSAICHVVPSWTWHAHRAAPGGDAVLFSATDEPVFKAFALDRAESRG